MTGDREEAPPRPDDEAGRALWDAQQQAALLRRQVDELTQERDALAAEHYPAQHAGWATARTPDNPGSPTWIRRGVTAHRDRADAEEEVCPGYQLVEVLYRAPVDNDANHDREHARITAQRLRATADRIERDAGLL